MNQFEDLLQERENSKLRSWKSRKAGDDRCTKYVEQGNPISEKLRQLQIQVLIDSDNNSKLQVNSTDLIQNLKGMEPSSKI